jgi:hypothetical protein
MPQITKHDLKVKVMTSEEDYDFRKWWEKMLHLHEILCWAEI